MYEILFLLKGEDISQASIAQLERFQRICHLQNDVKRQRMSALSGVDPVDIDLYIPKGRLQEFYRQLDRNEHPKLSGIVRIEDAFHEPRDVGFLVVFNPRDHIGATQEPGETPKGKAAGGHQEKKWDKILPFLAIRRGDRFKFDKEGRLSYCSKSSRRAGRKRGGKKKT